MLHTAKHKRTVCVASKHEHALLQSKQSGAAAGARLGASHLDLAPGAPAVNEDESVKLRAEVSCGSS